MYGFPLLRPTGAGVFRQLATLQLVATDMTLPRKLGKPKQPRSERAKIVAWLRRLQVGGTNGLIDGMIKSALEHVADRIEKGEHL